MCHPQRADSFEATKDTLGIFIVESLDRDEKLEKYRKYDHRLEEFTLEITK